MANNYAIKIGPYKIGGMVRLMGTRKVGRITEILPGDHTPIKVEFPTWWGCFSTNDLEVLEGEFYGTKR